MVFSIHYIVTGRYTAAPTYVDFSDLFMKNTMIVIADFHANFDDLLDFGRRHEQSHNFGITGILAKYHEKNKIISCK